MRWKKTTTAKFICFLSALGLKKNIHMLWTLEKSENDGYNMNFIFFHEYTIAGNSYQNKSAHKYATWVLGQFLLDLYRCWISKL